VKVGFVGSVLERWICKFGRGTSRERFGLEVRLKAEKSVLINGRFITPPEKESGSKRLSLWYVKLWNMILFRCSLRPRGSEYAEYV